MGINIAEACTKASSPDTVAIAAGVVALLALFVSVWQGYLARRHNFLSLRPLLEIYTDASAIKGVSIRVRNCGTGPAIIRSSLLTYEGQTYDLSQRSAVEQLMDKWQELGAPSCEYHAAFPSNDAVVGSNDDFYLLELLESEDMPAASAFFSDVFRNLVVVIRYESIYEKSYELRFEQSVIAHA